MKIHSLILFAGMVSLPVSSLFAVTDAERGSAAAEVQKGLDSLEMNKPPFKVMKQRKNAAPIIEYDEKALDVPKNKLKKLEEKDLEKKAKE